MMFEFSFDFEKGVFSRFDDFEFKFDGMECTIMPESATPPTPTPGPTTTSPMFTLPDCNFETDACGWFIDEFTQMKWIISNTSSLQEQGLESPHSDFNGNFLYVNALKGNSSSKTIVASPFVDDGTVAACIKFRFNIKVIACKKSSSKMILTFAA